jgi:hypothetical protein
MRVVRLNQVSRKCFFVPLVAAVWAAAIWFAVEAERRQSYSGPVARIERSDDKSALDIGSVSDMRQFCAWTTCVVRRLYDQSGGGAHMHKVD